MLKSKRYWEGETYSFSSPKDDLQPKSTGLWSVFAKFVLNLASGNWGGEKNKDLFTQDLVSKNKGGGDC